jgi:hypothetical protein
MRSGKIPRFVSDEEAVVWLAQRVRPALMPEYLMWALVWREDPRNGRGVLREPHYGALERGAGLFWDILDSAEASVQCFVPQGVSQHLLARYESDRKPLSSRGDGQPGR